MSISGHSITSGFIDLATYDELEKYLYGGPRAVSYFVRCVKRSTWFTQIPVPLKLTGTQDFNGEIQANVTRAGDYLLHVWLRVGLPRITTGSGVSATEMVRWTRNLMHHLVEEASITFNDLTAMKFDSHWLDFWSAFTVPASKLNGYNNMVGNFDELVNPIAASPSLGPGVGASLPNAILNVPLPFFFTRDSGVALPTAAIPYNDMKINIKLRAVNQLLLVDDTNTAGLGAGRLNTRDITSGVTNDLSAVPSLSFVQVWANYAIVSNEERVKMGKCPRDIVIEQVQDVPRQSFAAATDPNNYDLRLSHAIKALFWAARLKAADTTNAVLNDRSNYTTSLPTVNATGVSFNVGSDPILAHTLLYENTARLSSMGSDYFSLVNPFYHSIAIPLDTGYHMYSYSLDFNKLDPMGSTNFGKLTNVSLSLSPSTAGATTDDAVTSTSLAAGVGNNPNQPQTATWDMIIRALNHNVIRISGGALGFPVL